MPRVRRTVAEPAGDEFQLPGMGDLDQDPTPAAAVPRPRRASTRTTTKRTRAPRAANGRITSKAAQVNQVRAEIETYLTLANAAWSLRDPECSYVAGDAIPVVAERLTAIIARNDALLGVVTKSGIVGDIIGLLTALLPVARAVWSAHGPGGDGHGTREDREDADYPAYGHAR